MNEMFETKTDKVKRKLERTEKENKEKQKSRIRIIIIVSALVLISVAAILVNSNFVRRTLPVYTISGVNFSTTEFEFFYYSELMEYNQMMSQFQGLGLDMPDPGRLLSRQIRDEETGETWADYITQMALARMTGFTGLYNAAAAAGFILSDEKLAEIDEEISMVALQAMMSGFPTADSWLQQMFGNSMNESTFRSLLEFTEIAGSYSEYVRNSFSYTTEELAGYYNENRNDLDVFAYRVLNVNPEELNYDDFESDDAYEEALETAAADAHERAANIITGGIGSQEDFIAAAQEEYGSEMDWIAEVQYRMGENLDPIFKDWLIDESRNTGDITAFDNDTGSTILYFVSRDDNSYRTTGMKQILISREAVNPEEFPLGELDPEYVEALNHAEAEARERAEDVYALFNAAGRTEEALIDLMAEHSDDPTVGGEYTDISRFSYQSAHFRAMKVVPEIEEWLFDESRVVGDSELIYTSDFGYHLIYFTGLGTPFFELISDDRMRTRDHNEWLDRIPAGEPVRHAAFIFVHI